jgi:3-methyladenine DNA glycosylase Tag
MEAPRQITPKGLSDYLEVMSKVVFQSGMSWEVVERKWPGIREAFEGFDALRVASFTTKKLNALSDDPRVIRNRRKLDGIVHNARAMIELEEQHGSFKKYLRSHADFEAVAKDLRKRFKFVGDFGAFYFLYVVREPVPAYEIWCASRGRTPMTVSQ